MLQLTLKNERGLAVSQSLHSGYIITGFRLPPQFFFIEVSTGMWPPPLPPLRAVSIKLQLEC